MRLLRYLAQAVLAIVLGVLLLVPLGSLFGVMNWPMYHSWGLAHGAFFSAIPTLSIAVFGLLGQIPWFVSVADPYRRAAALLAGMGLTALFVMVRIGETVSLWSTGSILLFGAAFAASLILSHGARKPFAIALMIALPLLFNDAQFAQMPFDMLVGYAGFSMVRTTLPVLACALLGSWLARGGQRRTGSGLAKRPLLATLAAACLVVGGVLAYRWIADERAEVRVRVATVGDPPIVAVSASYGACSDLRAKDADGRRVFVAECVVGSKPVKIAARCSDASLPEAFIEHAFEPRAISNYVLFDGVCGSSPQEITDSNSRAAGTPIWRARRSGSAL